MTPIEFLKAELSAIDHLNRFYWQTDEPNRYEKLAYLVRQRRRQELITELLRLMQRGGHRFESLSSNSACAHFE
jgi:hypothetical protein